MEHLLDQQVAACAEIGLAPDAIPRHVAIIMDGNGRWALKRNLPRVEGHRAGADAVDDVVTVCRRLGVEVLTLYSFSRENWQRPIEEINALMELYLEYLTKEQQRLIDKNIRFVQLGRRDRLPQQVLNQVEETSQATNHCTGLTLALALNYSSRTEITDAVRAIAEKVNAGEIEADKIEESTIADHLYTAGLPDPDLLIRTAGEMRISNYLLWQISYAELYIADEFWPDFRAEGLKRAVCEYARRNRRYGALDESNS